MVRGQAGRGAGRVVEVGWTAAAAASSGGRTHCEKRDTGTKLSSEYLPVVITLLVKPRLDCASLSAHVRIPAGFPCAAAASEFELGAAIERCASRDAGFATMCVDAARSGGEEPRSCASRVAARRAKAALSASARARAAPRPAGRRARAEPAGLAQ